VSLVDFYNEEVRNNQPHAQQQIQSRKLYIDDSDLIAVESHDSLSLDSEDHPLINIAVPRTNLDLQEEEIEVPDTVTELEDQIAMESVNQHLKKFGSFGLKERDASDLVRKLTSVQPAPIGKQS
jgi:preprotein translocase subunit SecB